HKGASRSAHDVSIQCWRYVPKLLRSDIGVRRFSSLMIHAEVIYHSCRTRPGNVSSTTHSRLDRIAPVEDITKKLPPEILSLIFELACVTAKHALFFYERLRQMNALRQTRACIAGTCTRWHSIAMASPLLWSDIELHISDRTSFRDYLNLIPLEISRSGSCLLTLRIDIHFDYLGELSGYERHSCTSINMKGGQWDGWTSLDMDWTKLRHIFSSSAPRIGTYIVHSSGGALTNPFDFFVDANVQFPSMRNFCYFDCDDSCDMLAFDITRIPHIRNLQIRGFILGSIHFSPLTKLNLRQCFVGAWGDVMIFDLLASTRETLESLKLHCGPNLSIPNIQFPALREISWEGDISDEAFQNLAAPALNFAKLEGIIWRKTPPNSGFSNARTVVVGELAPEFIKDFFQLHPNVQKLCITGQSALAIATLWKESPSSIPLNLRLLHVYPQEASINGEGGLDHDTISRISAVIQQPPCPFILEVDAINDSSNDLCQDSGPLLRIGAPYPAWAWIYSVFD
ncbi:hypothetical protein DL93DRAFT_2213742, partial [Clavulina sp. PMI_390]